MRLGQLARKLALRPVQIVDFLAQNSIQIDLGNNTRLEDEHVRLVLQKYAPGELVENIEKEIAEEEAPQVPVIESVDEAAPFETVIPEIQPSLEEPKIEVIKAPKVELSGLKVLGKIDLPEPKKKEPATGNSESTDNPQKTEGEFRRPVRNERRERPVQSRPLKNPIAQQREKEAREAESKRKEEIEQQKEKRTLHYLKKMTVAQPVKSAKIQEEKFTEETIELPPAPTSVWGKFKRWLRS